MTLNNKFGPIRTAIYDLVNNFFKTLAQLFGYPENPGMPTFYQRSIKDYRKIEFISSLPKHKTSWPPHQKPETWFEVFFGPFPKVETISRHIYESDTEGFYNFYICNYKNLYFLPNALSEFIQVKLNICLDITALESLREAIFLACVVYTQIVVFRIGLFWFLYINPYTNPWCYLIATVDWVEDSLHGILPSVLGVNITSTVLLGIVGAVGDSLNHIVFTMPFLPGEGERMKLMIEGKLTDVIVFHYLPISWYRHPIPDALREFWYTQRPDILDYMQKHYKNVDIQFLPDRVVQELNHHANNVTQATNINISHFIPTELLSHKIETFTHFVPIHMF
jgi:hypothetical protein